jgi:hypothetical protein
MVRIGFSTGALARGDVRLALEMLQNKSVQIIEISALRQNELQPIVDMLDVLDLDRFEYKSFHAPSAMEADFEPIALKLLTKVVARGWPIVIHPDAMHRISEWSRFGDLLYVENMDKRKPIGQTADDLASIFEGLPNAGLCLDLGHARQVDPTMSEAAEILSRFQDRLKQLHVSGVNSQSQHDPLTLEAVLAFQRVSRLIPADVPIILESRVGEPEIEREIQSALSALTTKDLLAIAGG